jgi:dTDP-4-dehydrorhamnose reductase
MPTCLVTGASGFVGRAIAARLARDFDVVGVSFRQSGPGLVRADIRNPAAFRRLLAERQPAVVVHAAAYPEPDFCEEQPAEARRLNVHTVATLRDALPSSKTLVFISTDYVFDGTKPPYREDSPRRPASAYGRMKAEAEDLLSGRPNTIILRIPLQVGEGASQDRPGFIREMVNALKTGKEQTVDNVLVRFPTWTGDTAEAVAFLVGRSGGGVFHYSSPRGATRYAWMLETARVLGLKADQIKPSDTVIPRKAARPMNSQLASDKIRALGFDHFTDFSDVVRQTIGPV